jgi:hypothetical protein
MALGLGSSFVAPTYILWVLRFLQNFILFSVAKKIKFSMSFQHD